MHNSMACYKPVTHVIFDLDGTLINSVEVIESIFIDIAEKYGKHVSPSQRAKCNEKQSRETIASLREELNLPLSMEEIFQIMLTELRKPDGGGVKLKPGVEKLVRHLHDNNIPIAIATNSSKLLYDLTTRCLKDLIGFFHHSVLANNEPEVEKEKPAPDVFLVCARRFDEKPSSDKVLVIEDSPFGVQAAVAAGMQVVMVPNPEMDKALCKDATLILDSLERFQPELFGIPPFTKKQ